ncbi:MAG: leucine-rich repeat protein, partial [Clostridia bacterium]
MKKSRVVSVLIVVMVMLVATLAACSTDVSYKINFEVDGTQFTSINTSGKEAISLPTDPTKEGFAFDGWYFDKDVWEKPLTINSFSDEKLTSDTTVYAKWLGVFDLTFEVNGGSAVDTQKVVGGKFAIAPADPTKTGLSFVGWFKEASFATSFDFASDKITANTTIYAKWLEIFDLTFIDADSGASLCAPQRVGDGTFAKAPTSPTKAGFTFAGWYKETSLTTPFHFVSDKITADTTLYAKWVLVDECLTFMFTDSTNSAYSVAKKSGATLPEVIALPAEYNGKPVVAIGDSAFYNCSGLTSVTIPVSVTTIGNSAFDGCSSLTSVTFEAGSKLKTIGERAFYDCTSLTSLTIPAGVTIIGESVFSFCSSLTSVIIPAGVKNIGNGAFSYCSSLTSVTIPASVTTIGLGTFSSCNKLTDIIVDGGNTNYKSVDGNLYSNDGAMLIQYAVGKTATSFTIPTSATTIGNSAFSSCSSLTSV